MADGAPKRVRRQGPVRVKRLVAAYPLRRGLVRLRRVKRQLGHADTQMVTKVYGRFAPTPDERTHWQRAAELADIWNAWGRVRPALLDS